MPQSLGWCRGKDRVFFFFTEVKLCERYLRERSWWIEKSLAWPTGDWAADKQTYSIFPTFYCNLDAGCGFNQGWHRKRGGKQKLCWIWASNNSDNQGVVLCVNWAIRQPSRAKTFIGDPTCSCWIPASTSHCMIKQIGHRPNSMRANRGSTSTSHHTNTIAWKQVHSRVIHLDPVEVFHHPAALSPPPPDGQDLRQAS